MYRGGIEIWHDAPPLELYDLQADADEWQNRADDPALAELTAEHDAIPKPYVRQPGFRWRYPNYLAF
ncbi:MAG TPA: hypothetical protein PLF81_01705 [Candidatus Anammoximicrobium sp.]|nr:hypothetical protein [Candidatus Anammoximicrobium sp.]